MIGGTGLLTRDVVTESEPSHPHGQWLAGRVVRRLQLRGSGGVSPRFPFIPPVAFSFAIYSILKIRFLSAPRSLFKRMFQQAHLRGQICDFQDSRFGTAGTKGNAESRRGVSFTVADVDDNEAFLLLGGRSPPNVNGCFMAFSHLCRKSSKGGAPSPALREPRTPTGSAVPYVHQHR